MDVGIIGGGRTGTATAGTLLSNLAELRPAMLDVREAFSGATGCNGYRIESNLWELFLKLAAILQSKKARNVTEFRMGILDKILAIPDPEGVTEECQIRKVKAVDVYFDAES